MRGFLPACQPAESTTYWKPGYQAVNALTGQKNIGCSRKSAAKRISKQILPALLVAGSGLVAGSAAALELGDIKVESTLGQPLRASISYALNPNEQLFNYCIYLRPGATASGIPSVSKARISVTAGTILLTGTMPIREPALGLRLTVKCPYTAQLAREYTLMIDPGMPVGNSQMVADVAPSPQSAPRATPVAAVTESQVVAQPQRAAQVQAAKPLPKPTPISPVRAAIVDQVDQSPIATNSQYFVEPGDSLYGIATRIENRQVALRPAADAIFTANPDAFTNNDINLLTAGIYIAIPDFLGAGVAGNTVAETNTPVAASEFSNDFADEYAPETATAEQPADSTYAGFAADEVPAEVAAPVAELAPVAEVVEEVVVEEPLPVEEAVVAATPIVAAVEEPVVTEEQPIAADVADAGYVAENTADLSPGDVVIGADNSYATTDESDTAAPDETVAPAPTVQAAPVVSLPSDATNDSMGSWLMWLGGAGLGVLLGLVLFYGRRIKERFGAAPINDPTEQLDDDLTDEVEVISDFDPIIADEPIQGTEEPSIVADVDFQLDENMISSQAISLDADLDAGTGLQNVSDVDVAQDFGFSASTTDEVESAMDLEFPEEAPEVPEKLPTDIIPPNHRIEDSILDSEEPPSIDASAEYDLSMIVDATKQALGGDDLTAKDLMAVQIGEKTAPEDNSNDFTLSSEVDIDALEQDYQEEFTQTLAMNEEIEQAAIDLAVRLDNDESSEMTSALPSVAEATRTEAVLEEDILTEIASLDDDIDDLEATGVNPQLTARMEQPGYEKTVEMPNPGNEKTAMMPNPGSEPTVEMPNPGSEPTVEMPNPANEPTVEMQIESGSIDTKKSQAS